MSNLEFLAASHNHLHGATQMSCKQPSVPNHQWESTERAVTHVVSQLHNAIFDAFPFCLDKLPSPKVLVLRANRFYGPIEYPGGKHLSASLSIIDLSFNEFTGDLLKEFLQGLKAMITLNESKSEPKYIGDDYYHDSVTTMNEGLDLWRDSSTTYKPYVPFRVGSLL
ncbi:hypothetical protein Acr_17g0007880 [Actinidia rufa]|uniref:Leucine-rich repeat (LRR) family protein n=1 Tax=Actinidia rufa TaxID=165716 RepID=A0A7J0G349_9ERIC|nr:hypothetical protein Acr_17g0007880 [Actinidia rufa]